MANFFPKKLLELDSFLKVRDPFLLFKFPSVFGSGLSVKWEKSCVDSILFCTVKHSFLALQMKYFFVHFEKTNVLGVGVSLSGTNPKHP